MRVAIATARAAVGTDEDEPLLVAALDTHGVSATPAVWDDPGVDWSAFDLVVVRSTWDYPAKRDAFVAWAESVDAVTPVYNSPDVLRWNTDKRYLRDLQHAGVPTVPTSWFQPGDRVHLPDSDDIVVKPAVSAGSKDAARYRGDHPQAVDHVRRLLDAGRTVMVQPYLRGVDEHGETALLYIGGHYSHAVRKGPLLRPGAAPVEGLFAEEQIDRRTPSPAERALARRALARVPGDADRLLYARVDAVPDDAGRPVVLEVELAEPSLFLLHDPAAADRLATAILAQLARVRGQDR